MFQVREKSVDGILRKVFNRLTKKNAENFRVTPSKGPITEVFGAHLELTNPRNRLSRSFVKGKPFSALGEFLWYLDGNNEISFIEHYLNEYAEFSDDGGLTASGAYGPRIFGNSTNFERVINCLENKPSSRNAVIQIFSNFDAESKSKDIPCTCTLQFVIRNGKLYMQSHMRSNDAFLGLPHDIFSFTMMQEIAANRLGCELGTYQHSVGSLHLYENTDKKKNWTMAKQYLDEGYCDEISMPKMPKENIDEQIQIVLTAEKEFRKGNLDHSISNSLNPYWKDLVQLLKFYAMQKGKNYDENQLRSILEEIHHTNFYSTYLLDKFDKFIDPFQDE